MAGIDRRGFLTGLGALLGTTALVKPALPAIESVTSTIMAGEVSWVPSANLWYDIILWNDGGTLRCTRGVLSETPNPVDN